MDRFGLGKEKKGEGEGGGKLTWHPLGESLGVQLYRRIILRSSWGLQGKGLSARIVHWESYQGSC